MAMRLGTEDKKKRLIAMVAVSLALTFLAHMVWQLASGPPSSTPPAAATSSLAAPTAQQQNVGEAGHKAQHLESASALDPTLHPEIMAMAENTTYTGTSRNIFSKDSLPPVALNAIEKPVTSVRAAAVSSGPPPPPPPPPIDLKFYGFATQHNGQKLVFLMHGEDIFIAGQGDIVKGRYKVVQIDKNSVVIDDLSYNDNQTLPLQKT